MAAVDAVGQDAEGGKMGSWAGAKGHYDGHQSDGYRRNGTHPNKRNDEFSKSGRSLIRVSLILKQSSALSIPSSCKTHIETIYYTARTHIEPYLLFFDLHDRYLGLRPQNRIILEGVSLAQSRGVIRGKVLP